MSPAHEALAALVAQLDACGPHIADMTVFCDAHGYAYSGPSYSEELERARQVLAEEHKD